MQATWQTVTGVTFALPGAGDYDLKCTLQSLLTAANTGDSMQFRLQNTTTGNTVEFAVTGNHLIYVVGLSSGSDNRGVTLAFQHTTTGGDTIELQAIRNILGTFTTAQVSAAHMSYMKIG